MKLYSDMTKRQQLEYRTDIVADWIKDGVPFALILLSRKVRTNSGGWYWTSEWCWKDSEGDLKPIDKRRLYEKLGITERSTDPYLASNLKAAGYDIIDLDHVIVFNLNNKENQKMNIYVYKIWRRGCPSLWQSWSVRADSQEEAMQWHHWSGAPSHDCAELVGITTITEE